MKPVFGVIGNGHLAEHFVWAANQKGFVATSARHADIVYIAPDRPEHNPRHSVDYALKEMRKDAVLVIHCQVVPGFTRKINWPKQQLYYHVETLKVNNEAKERALNPERIIIGCTDASNPFIEYKLLGFLQSFNCPILPMSYESAELAKIAINIYLASQIETSNKLSKIAEKIGANWNDIIPALQYDKRIGQYAYLKPGEFGKHLQRDIDTINLLLKSDQ